MITVQRSSTENVTVEEICRRVTHELQFARDGSPETRIHVEELIGGC